MASITRQANFTLPEDLLDEVKRMVPKGEQSKVVGEALRHELKRIKFKKALQASFGAWTKGAHPELADGLSVRSESHPAWGGWASGDKDHVGYGCAHRCAQRPKSRPGISRGYGGALCPVLFGHLGRGVPEITVIKAR